MKRPDGIAVRPFPMLFEGAGGNHSPRWGTGQSPDSDEPGELAGQLAEVADPHVSGMVEAIRRELDDVLAGGGSFAEFSARLSNLYPVLDTADLTEALEGAFLAANLAGREHAKGS